MGIIESSDGTLARAGLSGAEDGGYSPMSPGGDRGDVTPIGGSGPEESRPDPPEPVPGQLGDRDLVNQNPDEPDEVIELQAEQAPVQVIRSPSQPTQADIEHHNACGHVPFRDYWCPVCVQTSAPEDGHRSKNEEHSAPTFCSDYAFMRSKDGKQTITLFVVKERKSKSIFSTVVPRKGVAETDEAINFMIDCIAELGYKECLVYLKNCLLYTSDAADE